MVEAERKGERKHIDVKWELERHEKNQVLMGDDRRRKAVSRQSRDLV